MTARALLATTIAFLLTFPLLAQGNDGDLPTATVLCYHIVEAPADPRMEIGREAFRQQMRYLAMTGYNVIPLKHLYEYVSGKRATLPPNAIVITIDDGWRSTYTEAYPELKKRGFPFTVFVYPNIIGKTANALNWEQVREMADNGGDIESHSLTHPFLTRRRHETMNDAAYTAWLQRELVESKRILEKETGKSVSFLAYPYGDYDHYLKAAVAKAGYEAALTCEYGPVRKGSDPLRMRRFVVDKRMDFAAFRHYLGAGQLQLADLTPTPGKPYDAAQTVISARIPRYKSVDPKSVGLALISLGSTFPYSYDAQTGEISLIVSDAIASMKGKYHRAIVWARDKKTGKRIEGSWTFEIPDPSTEPLPSAPVSVPIAAQMIPSVAAAAGSADAVTEGRAIMHHAPK